MEIMETKLHFLQWPILLILSVSSLTSRGQTGPYPNTGVQTVCLNSDESYGVINSTGSTYTWTIIPASGGTITGYTNTISIHWTTSGNFTLQVIEKNSAGCDSAPVTITVTVLPLLQPGTITANQTICPNTVPSPFSSVNATGGTGTYSYQWDSSPDEVVWTAITGATTAGYSPAALTATTYYRLHQASGTCTVVTNTVKITVSLLPVTSPIYHN